MPTTISVERIETHRRRYEVTLGDGELRALSALRGDEALAFLESHAEFNVQEEDLIRDRTGAVRCESPTGDVDLRRQLAIEPSGSRGDEVRIATDTGVTMVAPAYPSDCYYVRLVDDQDREIAYWDSAEWRDDPELVVGAIIGAICKGG
jgi:hypothetical protein